MSEKFFSLADLLSRRKSTPLYTAHPPRKNFRMLDKRHSFKSPVVPQWRKTVFLKSFCIWNVHTDVFCFWLQIHALKMPSGKIHFYAQSESEEEGRRSASTSLRCVLSVRISWRYSKTKSCRQNETFRERHSVVKNKHVCKLDNLCFIRFAIN